MARSLAIGTARRWLLPVLVQLLDHAAPGLGRQRVDLTAERVDTVGVAVASAEPPHQRHHREHGDDDPDQYRCHP